MGRTALMTRLLAMALAAFAVVSVVTPVCAMPECGDVATGTCSDFMPACDDCPDTIVMKHTHDDATKGQGHSLESPVAVAFVLPAAYVVPVQPLPEVPDATASPPPLDPLGVRLTV
ncbi:MAG: hypothetical protein JW733_06435 [Coriobacteriia bacterium]|nr:hypothetical protein [Coriobacteriia bacterium]MBN2847935.1 hypothetical protein [Coriobacteriia bacterium]